MQKKMGRDAPSLRGYFLQNELTNLLVSQVERAYIEGTKHSPHTVLAQQATVITDKLRDYLRTDTYGYDVYCAIVCGDIHLMYVTIAPKGVIVTNVPSSLSRH